MGLAAFTERYRKWCKRNGCNFSSDKAAELHAGAKDQITMLIRQAIDSLNAVSRAVEQLKAEMLQLSAQLPEYLVVIEMCGVGNTLGPSSWRRLEM